LLKLIIKLKSHYLNLTLGPTVPPSLGWALFYFFRIGFIAFSKCYSGTSSI